jgi:hypothetical protein
VPGQFVTEFGETIALDDTYRSRHKRNWTFAINAPRAQESKKIGLSELYRNVSEYGIVADFLTRQGLLNRKYDNALDIGGSVGVFARYLRANGNVRKITVVDIKDGSGRFSWPHYFLFWLKYKLEVFASKFLPQKVGVLRKNNNKYGYGMNLGSSSWTMGLWYPPVLDDYAATDFMIYQPKRRFDLIVSVNAIAYFDYNRLFEKLREITTDEATVCIFTDYWWYPVNATTIYGDFPYAAQRLTKNDLIRYFKSTYPSAADAMQRAYEFYHAGASPPTIGDFALAAGQHGFEFVGSERMMPKRWSHDNRSPFVPSELPTAEVLRDIHKFRPDITIEDLHTSHILMAFKKRPK